MFWVLSFLVVPWLARAAVVDKKRLPDVHCHCYRPSRSHYRSLYSKRSVCRIDCLKVRLKQATGLPTIKIAKTTTMQIVYSSRAGSQQRSRLLIFREPAFRPSFPFSPQLNRTDARHGQILHKPLNSPSCPYRASPYTTPSLATSNHGRPRIRAAAKAVHGFQC